VIAKVWPHNIVFKLIIKKGFKIFLTFFEKIHFSTTNRLPGIVIDYEKQNYFKKIFLGNLKFEI